MHDPCPGRAPTKNTAVDPTTSMLRERAAAVAPTKNTTAEPTRQKRRSKWTRCSCLQLNRAAVCAHKRMRHSHAMITRSTDRDRQPLHHTQKSILLSTLEAIPADAWYGRWDPVNTMNLRMTSKSVKEIVDKMQLPTWVRFSKKFWVDAHALSPRFPQQKLLFTRLR